MIFNVEYTQRAVRDLKSLPKTAQKFIVEETIKLESDPFPFKKKIKKIHGFKFACYRMRVNIKSDSFRVFFGINNDIIFILRIVAKKDAEKILKNIKFQLNSPS